MYRTDARNAGICAALIITAFFLVNPFAEMPFCDDWSYAFTVRRLLDTGAITYNGGATTMIVAHVLWGALFSKLFGFGFTVLRFSSLPFAAGSAALAYVLARQAGLRPSLAFFASLVLCLSPLFLPLATSFMTDVPGLFFILASLVAIIHGAKTPDSWHAAAWLFIGTLAAAIGGTSRQIVWAVPLSLLPYLVLLRRQHLLIVATSILLWILIVAEAAASIHWFNRQPYSVPEWPLGDSLPRAFHFPGRTLILLVDVCLTAMWLALPAAMFYIPLALGRIWIERRRRRGVVAASTAILVALAFGTQPKLSIVPYLGDTLSPAGCLGQIELSGDRPSVPSTLVRELLGAAVILVCFVLVEHLACWLLKPHKAWLQLRDLLFPTDLRVALPAIALFTLAYLCLLIPRAAFGLIFDRYALPLVLFAAIGLLALFQSQTSAERFPLHISIPAYVLLVCFALVGLAFTQDVLALARARAAAVRLLREHAIPATEIAAGIEYDCWTQAQAVGHVNKYEIRVPPNAFNPMQGYTPALKCLYRVEFQPRPDTIPSEFGFIAYRSWLPPNHRRIYIDRFRNPWWLETGKPLPQPVPQNFETFYTN
jgi:hypothetical protein